MRRLNPGPLAAATLGIAVLNGWAVELVPYLRAQGPGQGAPGSIELLVAAVGVAQLARASRDDLPDRALWRLVPVLPAMLVPSSLAAWLGLLLAAPLAALAAGGRARTGLMLLAALAAASLWERAGFKAATPFLLPAETQLLAWLLQPFMGTLQVSGNVLEVGQGHAIMLARGCSIFSQLGLALTAWTALRRLVADAAPLPWSHGLALAAVLVGINLARLSAMTVGPEWYALAHGPQGAAMADAASVLAIAAAAFLPELSRLEMRHARAA